MVGTAASCPGRAIPSAEGQPPAALHYEQWIGPSPYHPYSPQYFGGSNGLNCLFWNMYRDFGVGPDGRHGRAHDGPGLERDRCRRADVASRSIRKSAISTTPISAPVKLKATFEHPANKWRGPDHAGVVSGRAETGFAQELHGRVEDRQWRHLRGHQGQRFSPTSPPHDPPQQR